MNTLHHSDRSIRIAWPREKLSLVDQASELAAQYSEHKSLVRRRKLAQFFTPAPVAGFMASLVEPSRDSLRVLDPGAGTGILSCALLEALPDKVNRVHVDAWELDSELTGLCEQSLDFAKSTLRRRGKTITFCVRNADFVLENAALLRLGLFEDSSPRGYDVAIANPPYFKLSKRDPLAISAAEIVHGQPNIYALFMAVMASMLNEDGRMVTITPRSFASGPYFRQFRRHLFTHVVPQTIHLFHSRAEAFRKDDILQENVILCMQRKPFDPTSLVEVSSSNGTSDLPARSIHHVPMRSVLDPRSHNRQLHMPVSASDDEIISFVNTWPASLRSIGMAVSTGPVVAFRAESFLVDHPQTTQRIVPLLWLQNVRSMAIEWPIQGASKPQYILDTAASAKLLVQNMTYVLLRRFAAKEERRRLVAAPLRGGLFPGPRLGLENHLNYVYRPGGKVSIRLAVGLSALLGSALLDRYLRVSNGITQVNAEDIRSLPLPPSEVIEKLGDLVGRQPNRGRDLELAVAEVLRIPKHILRILNVYENGQD